VPLQSLLRIESFVPTMTKRWRCYQSEKNYINPQKQTGKSGFWCYLGREDPRLDVSLRRLARHGDAIAHETHTVIEADAGSPPQHRTSNSCGRKACVSEAQGKHTEIAGKDTEIAQKRTQKLARKAHGGDCLERSLNGCPWPVVCGQTQSTAASECRRKRVISNCT
jgi:hypothetical protein